MEQNDFPQSPPQGDGKKFRKAVKIIITVILLIGISVALFKVLNEFSPNNRGSRAPVRDWIRFEGGNKTAAAPASESRDTHFLRIAIAPIVSPETSMEMYEPFNNYLAQKLGRKPNVLYKQTYSETNELVRYQQCDIAIVCTYPFIRGEKEFGMQALVVPQINGEQTYQSILLVPYASPARSLLDLRGKRFASADIISTTGWLFPAMLLMDAGENPNKFFGEHIITGSHDRSLQAVVDGFVDGAAVHGVVYSQMVARDPAVHRKVRVLAKSSPFGIPPIVVNPNLEPELRNAILHVLLNMHEDAAGKAILKKLQIDRFVVPDANLFTPLRLAVSKLEKWR